ncbi:uncharacterized protein LOC118711140 [Pipistrellus kuhlii]|uniref:uncharacterized protein LOC118711140 n=1 Tax=Pipistrellus kuhlii TaxID=59472 RepID=UPI001E26F99F|nr:uncharacterized protein LOC118711140 [Pipistrellus kuhlii]
MYGKILIALLLSGYIFTSTADPATSTEKAVEDPTGEYPLVSYSANDPTPANARTVKIPRDEPGITGLSIFLNSCPGVIVMTQQYFMGPVSARKL